MPLSLQMLGTLVLILVAAEIFTNALEHFGERIGISEGVTGSLLAAVGTAMPESIVPLVAVLAGGADAHVNSEIGVGAILGAPLMLSTLSVCVMALSVVGRRGWQGNLRPERSGLSRDLTFFLVAYAVGIAALFVPAEMKALRAGAVVVLLVTYLLYVLLTLRVSSKLVEEGHGTEAHGRLFLSRAGLPTNFATILLQVLIGLATLVAGAKAFVFCVTGLSASIGISPLVLSLLIVPIATELPEKVNSVIWIRRGKDTLAFGNITGALVFQGSLLPALGIAITPWQPTPEVLSGIVVTMLAGGWLWLLARRGHLRVWHLAVNGAVYAAYLGVILT